MGFGQAARWALPGFSAATLGAPLDLTRCQMRCRAMRVGGSLGPIATMVTKGWVRDRSLSFYALVQEGQRDSAGI